MNHSPRLEDLRLNGMRQARLAGETLKGLGCHEGLVRISALRKDIQKQKLLMYTKGLSPEEVDAWSKSYQAHLANELTAWLSDVQP